MHFKKAKYYTVLSMLIVMIVACVGLSSFSFANTSGDGSNADGDKEEVIPVPPETDGDNNGQESAVPSIRNGIKLINYAIDIMENGKGYESSYFSEQKSTVSGVSVTQYVKTNRKKSGVFNREEVFSKCAMNLAPDSNYARLIYNENSNYYTSSTFDRNFESETATYSGAVTHYDNDEDFFKKFHMYFNNFPVRITSDKCKIINSTTEDGVYVLNLVYDVTKFDQYFVDSFTKVSDSIKSVDFKSMQYTFYINKANGHLLKTVRKDQYVMIPTVAPIPLTVIGTTTEVFSKMDKSFTIEKPLFIK